MTRSEDLEIRLFLRGSLRHRRGSRRQAEAVKDPADRLGRIDGCDDPHPAAAAITNQRVHEEETFEELSPRIVPGPHGKLLTATAVMQLVERHQVALDRDVNAYLKRFKLESSFPELVTLAHLLTHTGGFAEHIHGQHELDPAKVRPLADYLAGRMPPRVTPPGQLFSYSDHGMLLAGFIVEEVSGQAFADYVQAQVFKPLGMTRSTFKGRPEPALMADLATGYRIRDGRNVPFELDYVHTVPAAGLYTTGLDISRFMIAQLQYGRLGDTRILSEATAKDMQARHFAHHPKLRGRAFGFSELFINGQRILFHDGGMPGFTSRLCLLPDQGLGFFVSYTSDRHAGGRLSGRGQESVSGLSAGRA